MLPWRSVFFFSRIYHFVVAFLGPPRVVPVPFFLVVGRGVLWGIIIGHKNGGGFMVGGLEQSWRGPLLFISARIVFLCTYLSAKMAETVGHSAVVQLLHTAMSMWMLRGRWTWTREGGKGGHIWYPAP